MTSFSFSVLTTSLVVLFALLTYTLALMRANRLSAHVALPWILAEVTVIGAVVLWGRLPVITYTASLGDRELLVILAVLFFGLVAFLMLDSLQRISAQGAQLRRLTQEIAILQQRLDQFESGPQIPPPKERPLGITPASDANMGFIVSMLATWWIIGCLVLYVLEANDGLPNTLFRLLLASYKQ